MTNKPPLKIEMDGWTRNQIRAHADELRKYGPSLRVVVRSHAKMQKLHHAIAQIDTGANHSCVSPGLARKLGVAVGSLKQHTAGREAQRVPVHRCSITFHNGAEVDADIAVLASLSDPHDVLIGRDILQFCRLVIDFTSGHWELHLKKS